MSPAPRTGESHALRGAIDRGALLDFRDTFERAEPLADGSLDDFLDPRTLQIELEQGVGDAERTRLDVVWTTEDDYTVHYTDDVGRNLGWDVHPHDYPAPDEDRHFHPPPGASNAPESVEKSAIEVTEHVLVAMAAQQLWRAALNRGSLTDINEGRHPP